jgi:hypothetical protein
MFQALAFTILIFQARESIHHTDEPHGMVSGLNGDFPGRHIRPPNVPRLGQVVSRDDDAGINVSVRAATLVWDLLGEDLEDDIDQPKRMRRDPAKLVRSRSHQLQVVPDHHALMRV